MQLGRRGEILLIIAVGLAVFYPVIFAEVSVVDDVSMLSYLKASQTWNLKGVFIPGGATGLYYRPMVHMSFLVDRFLFQLDPVFLHLHNVVLHIVNAILVYCLSHSLLTFTKVRMKWLPLTAALCFCLHPVTTESVAWISGRTDLVAGVFILSSAVTLLHFRISGCKGYLVLSVFLFLLATLSKEISLAFFPGMLLMLTARGGSAEREGRGGAARPFFLAGLAALLLFFLFRSLAFTSNESRIGMTLISMKNDLTHAVMVVLGAFGFYMKKIVLPLPLNFAIVEVDPLYQLLALPLIVFCAYLLLRRSMAPAIYLSGVFLIAPSFVIAFGQIAWTPYAERYVYLPSAFMLVGMLFYLGQKLPAAIPKPALWLAIGLLPLLGGVTFARNVTWGSNYAILEDTVQKSPYCSEVRLLFSSQLAERGELTEALAHAKASLSSYRPKYDDRPELSIAEILQKQGKTDEAIAVTEAVLQKQQGRSVEAAKGLVSLWQDKVENSRDAGERASCNRKLLESCRLLYSLNKDPLALFRMGVASRSLNEPRTARGYFQETLDAADSGAELKLLARREMARLEER